MIFRKLSILLLLANITFVVNAVVVPDVTVANLKIDPILHSHRIYQHLTLERQQDNELLSSDPPEDETESLEESVDSSSDTTSDTNTEVDGLSSDDVPSDDVPSDNVPLLFSYSKGAPTKPLLDSLLQNLDRTILEPVVDKPDFISLLSTPLPTSQPATLQPTATTTTTTSLINTVKSTLIIESLPTTSRFIPTTETETKTAAVTTPTSTPTIETISLLTPEAIVTELLNIKRPCNGQIVERKEIRQLTTKEWRDFVNAVRGMHAGPSPSFYDQIAVVHQKYANNAHGLPDFLTWHRLYLATFQEALWKQNPNVILPYWKWSIDSQLPHASEVLSNRFFGGNGDQSRGGCLSTGYFANWGSLYVDGEDSTSVTCVTRSYDEGNSLGAFYSPEAIDAIIVSSKTYDELRSTLEGPPHGAIHAGIGGSFTSMASSSDPIFWVHHAYVDMIWWQWQKRSIKNLNDFSGFVDDSYEPRHLNSTVEPFNVLNSDALNTEGPGLCYRYIDYVPNSSVRKVIQQTMVTSASTGNSTLQESLIFDDKDPRILRILRDSWQNEHYNNSSNSTNSDSTAKHPFNNSGAAKTNVKWALPTKSVYVVAVNSTDDSTQDNSALSPLSNDSLNTSDWPDFVTNGNENERQYLNAVYKATVLDKKSTWLTRLTSRTPELVQIKTPRPLSDNYIVMNGLNKKHVRQVEARLGNTIGAVNRLQNYISPASLLARQDDILRTASDALRYGQGWAVQVVDELRPMLHGFNQRLRQALRLFMLQKHH